MSKQDIYGQLRSVDAKIAKWRTDFDEAKAALVGKFGKRLDTLEATRKELVKQLPKAAAAELPPELVRLPGPEQFGENASLQPGAE